MTSFQSPPSAWQDEERVDLSLNGSAIQSPPSAWQDEERVDLSLNGSAIRDASRRSAIRTGTKSRSKTPDETKFSLDFSKVEGHNAEDVDVSTPAYDKFNTTARGVNPTPRTALRMQELIGIKELIADALDNGDDEKVVSQLVLLRDLNLSPEALLATGIGAFVHKDICQGDFVSAQVKREATLVVVGWQRMLLHERSIRRKKNEMGRKKRMEKQREYVTINRPATARIKRQVSKPWLNKKKVHRGRPINVTPRPYTAPSRSSELKPELEENDSSDDYEMLVTPCPPTVPKVTTKVHPKPPMMGRGIRGRGRGQILGARSSAIARRKAIEAELRKENEKKALYQQAYKQSLKDLKTM